MTTPFPLAWPDHIDRSARREKSAFKTSLAGAIENVRTSLRLFARDSGKAVADVVISSDVTLGVEKPSDPGVAVWFSWDGMSVAIPVDRYLTPAENLQAIHHVLEARRVELRHGTLALVRASMRGFTALPAPAGRPKRPKWFEVLGVHPETRDAGAFRLAYREKAKTVHPDKPGGSEEAMTRLNVALDEALRLVGES